MTGELSRLVSVASLSLRGSLRGPRLIGLAAFALVPTLIVAAIASAHPAPRALSNAAEGLFASLTVPIVVMVIVLVLSVGQFRNEIDAETLVYLTDRSVSRVVIVLGKFLGALVASLALILPAALLPLAVASLAGGPAYAANVPVVLATSALLAAAAYGGFFLLLGLVSRSALLIGLLYGFLWEELLPLLPGDVPRLTVSFYLRDLLARELTTGPLSGYPAPYSIPVGLAVIVFLTLLFLAMGSASLRYLETSPEREAA